MSEELGRSAGIATDVVLEFDKSIKNIQDFGAQLELLDARFGSLENRIDLMKSSLSALSAQTSRGMGSNLRKQLESELNTLVAANGVVFSSIGSAPLKVKQQTVRNLFARVDAELNRAILKQIGNINVKIDPDYNTGTINIGKDEFDELNKEIARLIKTQTANLVSAIKKSGANLFDETALNGLKLDIGKGTVQEIMKSIKKQIKPIITNPTVADGVKLNFTKADMNGLLSKIKAKVKESLEIDPKTLGKSGGVDDELHKTARQVDKVMEQYVENIRRGMAAIDPRKAEVPIDNLSKTLRKHIARELGTTIDDLEKNMPTVDRGSANRYELQRQFGSLERIINSKMTRSTSEMMTELKRDVNAVEITTNPQLKHYLIHEINKLNNEIVKKIREQVDNQFQHMRAEVESVNTDPRNINRNGKLNSMAGGNGGRGNTTIINNNYGSKAESRVLPNDPYARRDAHFNGTGLEGAIVNTIRHIVAGSAVGAPIMAAYQAMETFKVSQMELLKIRQNYMLKDDFQYTDKNGVRRTDHAKVEREVEELQPYIKRTAGLYAVDYGEMSQVASVASRMTESGEEARQFMDYATMIYRLDNEGDLVNTIAPGLEAIMGQFDKSVWHMDEAVKAFGYSTSVSKATTDELMNSLMRSGSTFNANNIGITEATMMTTAALQATGLGGEDIGNMFKTFNTRLGMESVRNKLSEYGIQVYEKDEYGREMKRDGMEIYTELGNLVATNRIGDKALDELLQATAGGFQIGKVRAFIESLNNLGIEGEAGLNVNKMVEDAQNYAMDEVYNNLSKGMNSNILSMERAGVEFNIALTSVLESLSPAIEELADVVVNLSKYMQENSDQIAALVGVIGNTLLGAGLYYGGAKLLNKQGFQTNLANAQLHDNLWGGRGLSGRTREGSLNSISHLLDESRSNPLQGKNKQHKEWINAAMQNAVLAPYITELAGMDSKRKAEIESYMKENRGKGARTTDLADLLTVLDESRGYEKRSSMSADDMHKNSAYNARQLVANKAMTNVLTGAFATSLVDVMSDRNKFLQFNAQSNNRAFTREFSRMDNGQRGDFASYLERNYASVGNTISDMTGLQTAFADFNEEQRRTATEARNNGPHLENLRNEINHINDSMNRAGSGNRFLNFLDSLGQRSRAVLPTLATLGKTIGGFAGQMALFYALGDITSSIATNAGLTYEQKKVRDKKTEIDVVNTYAEMQQMKEDGDWKGFLEKSVIGGFFNTIRDAWSPGNQHVGLNDTLAWRKDFNKWADKKYGTTSTKQILEKMNSNLKEGEEKKTAYDIAAEYRKDRGLDEEFNKLDKENFMKEYKELAVAQSKQDEMRRLADEQMAKEKAQKWEAGEGQSGTTISDTLDTMKSKLDELRLDNSFENVNALLNGVKSNSVEYLKLRKKQLQEEQAVYEKQMEMSRKQIALYRQQLRELEESGKDMKWDKKKKEWVETKKYKKTKEELEKEELRKKEVEKEFGEDYANSRLEQRRLDFQIATKPIQERLDDASHNRRIADLRSSLSQVEGSKAFYDDKIANATAELETMKNELAAYQAIDPSLDVDGELKNIMKNLEQSILDQTVELKNLRLQRVLSYRDDLDKFNDNQDIDTLKQQIALGGVDAGDPAMRNFRISQYAKEKNELEKHIANLRAATQDPNASPDEVAKIQAEIRELTKQSLNAQLGILQEMKNTGGTFNLPDGVKAMSQYDYMASKNSHTNMTLQAGDTYVSITLPNVNGSTGTKQLTDIGQSIGQGIADGRLTSLRKQMNGAPYVVRQL